MNLPPDPELNQCIKFKDVHSYYHISCVTPDKVWISDSNDDTSNNLSLINTTGDTLFHLKDLYHSYTGAHTVNNDRELIYIDMRGAIIKLSKDMKTSTTFIAREDTLWMPQCVYSSPNSGDLLVGMFRKDSEASKVTRYTQTGQISQTIQYDNSGLDLYRKPVFLTENNNGDVVVSDYNFLPGAIVVTGRGGEHRFSYTGHPHDSGIEPSSICTDALSHILVLDAASRLVEIIDKNGRFLSHLSIQSDEIPNISSLSYDVITHRLWVNLFYNNYSVCVYNYPTKQNNLTGMQ